MDSSKAIGIGVAGLSALGLGLAGASMASADDASAPSSSTSSSSSTEDGTKGERQAPVDDGRELSADAASKAIAAAEAKESDATVKGVHLGHDGEGYEVQMLRSDGTMVEVVVDDSFTVTGVEEREGRGGPGGGHGHGPRGGQAPGGETQQQTPQGDGESSSTPSESSTSSESSTAAS